MTAPTKFIMHGQLPVAPYSDVIWSVYGSPDTTGAFSGYGAGYLINIYVDYTVQDNVVAGGNVQAAQVPVPAPGPIVPKVQYVMKALCSITTPANQMVTWKVNDSPDFTGVHSGYPTSSLSDIVVDYTINDSVTSGSQATQTSGAVGGDLSGALPSPTVVGLQNHPISSASPTLNQVLEWNGSAWAPASIPLSGNAGGDLSGTYPNPSVVKIQGFPISATSPTTGYVLTWNGTNWIASAAGSGGPPSGAAGGDLSGLYPNPTVAKLQTYAVATTAPTDGYVLTWKAVDNQWEPLPSAGGGGGGTPSGPASGDLAGFYPGPSVAKINGTTVATGGGALTTGKVLRVTGVSTVDYGAVDLANSNAVTGILPTGNQAAQSLSGDVTGTTAASTVIKINGASVLTGGGALVSGQPLRVTGSSSVDYGPLDLANGSAVTGLLPNANQAAQSLSGDLSGNTAAANVIKLQNRDIDPTAPTNLQVLTWNSTNNRWEPQAQTGGPPSGTAGGDLSGSYPNPTVAKANGATIPAAGSLTVGNTLQVSGASSLSYGPLNLAGGTNYVTGSLPIANQDAQVMNGDVTGTTAVSTVAKIKGTTVTTAGGALTTGQVLRVTGVSTVDYGPLDLSNSSAITGTLPISNQASQTLSGDVTGTTAANTVVSLTGSAGILPIASTGNEITWNTSTTKPRLKQADRTTASGTGELLTIQAQNETGTTSVGGSLDLTSGTGTSSDGYVAIKTGGVTRLTANATGVITVANLSTGVVHADSSGNLTSSTIVNADVSGSAAIAYSKLNLSNSIVNADINTAAAIAYSKLSLSNSIVNADINSAAAISVSKLAAGTAGQILLNNATPTPTWTSISGDISLSTSGTVTVAKINGASVPAAGSLTTGNVLQVNGSSSLTYGPVNLAGGANYITGILPVTNLPSLQGDVTGTITSNTVGQRKSFLLMGA